MAPCRARRVGGVRVSSDWRSVALRSGVNSCKRPAKRRSSATRESLAVNPCHVVPRPLVTNNAGTSLPCVACSGSNGQWYWSPMIGATRRTMFTAEEAGGDVVLRCRIWRRNTPCAKEPVGSLRARELVCTRKVSNAAVDLRRLPRRGGLASCRLPSAYVQ